MRFVLALSLLATAGLAHASFELVMVADRGTQSVHRFDGNTGLYLGSFGGGYVQNPIGMCIDQATGRAFVVDAVSGDGSTNALARVWTFNYNTGEYLSSFSAPYSYVYPQIAFRNNVLYLGISGSIVDAYSTSGSILNSYQFTGSSAPRGTAVDDNGKIWTVEGNKVYTYLPGGGTTAFTMASSVAASTSNGQRQIAISGSRMLAAGAISISRINLSGLVAANPANPISTSTYATYTAINGVGFGHGDIGYYTGTVSAGQGRISRILYSEGLTLQTFGTGILNDPRSVAVVVAPEPSSFVALGIGALALLRRRKRA